MKFFLRLIIWIALFYLVPTTTFSQINSAESQKSNSNWKLITSYLNDVIYYGRKDSIATPYCTPSLTYTDKSGFYFGGSFSIYTGIGEKRIDMYAIDLGYDIDFNDYFSGSIYANKSFYNDNSTAIKSDINAIAGAIVSYDFSLLQLNSGVDVLFSQKPDVGVNIGISRELNLGTVEKGITITPSFVTYFSTLHFYEGYTSRKTGKLLKRVNPNIKSIESITTVDNAGMKLLDYEFSLNMDIEKERWGCFLYPNVAIPTTPIYTTTRNTIKLNNGSQIINSFNSTPYTEKTLKLSFYVEGGLYLKF